VPISNDEHSAPIVGAGKPFAGVSGLSNESRRSAHPRLVDQEPQLRVVGVVAESL
jgi:hypothetical protein